MCTSLGRGLEGPLLFVSKHPCKDEGGLLTLWVLQGLDRMMECLEAVTVSFNLSQSGLFIFF